MRFTLGTTSITTPCANASDMQMQVAAHHMSKLFSRRDSISLEKSVCREPIKNAEYSQAHVMDLSAWEM